MQLPSLITPVGCANAHTPVLAPHASLSHEGTRPHHVVSDRDVHQAACQHTCVAVAARMWRRALIEKLQPADRDMCWLPQLRLLLERVSKRERLKRERFHVLRDTWAACLEDPGPGLAMLRSAPPVPLAGTTPDGPSPAVAPLNPDSQPLQLKQVCIPGVTHNCF